MFFLKITPVGIKLAKHILIYLLFYYSIIYNSKLEFSQKNIFHSLKVKSPLKNQNELMLHIIDQICTEN